MRAILETLSKADKVLVEELFQRTLLNYDRIFTGEPFLTLFIDLPYSRLTDLLFADRSGQDAELSLAADGGDVQGQQRVSRPASRLDLSGRLN